MTDPSSLRFCSAVGNALFIAAIVTLLLHASLSQAAPMLTTNTEEQKSPSSSENTRVVDPDQSLQPIIAIPANPTIEATSQLVTLPPSQVLSQLTQCPSGSVPCPPCPPDEFEKTTPPSSPENTRVVHRDQSSLQPTSSLPNTSATPQSPPPFSQLTKCPPDSVPCSPCQSEKPTESEKPAEPQKKTNWGFMSILNACYKATIKFCSELITTTGKEYTEQRKQREKEKKTGKLFACCVIIKNEPPSSIQQRANDGEQKPQTNIAIPPMSLTWASGRTSATITNAPGAPNAPGPATIAPGAKSRQDDIIEKLEKKLELKIKENGKLEEQLEQVTKDAELSEFLLYVREQISMFEQNYCSNLPSKDDYVSAVGRHASTFPSQISENIHFRRWLWYLLTGDDIKCTGLTKLRSALNNNEKQSLEKIKDFFYALQKN